MILPEGAAVVGCRRCGVDIFQEEGGKWATVAYPTADPYGCEGGAHAPAGSLFELGPFALPDGRVTGFKIECDLVELESWAALARVAAELLDPFGAVEGVPRGGVAFAEALEPYIDPSSKKLLIADDVWVSGTSMERHRAGRDALGVVAFARNPVAQWVKSILYLNPEAEAATYRLQ